MPWWQFRKKAQTRAPVQAAVAEPGQPRRRAPAAADSAMQPRLDQLLKRRDLIAFDVERAKAAHRPENPWRERIDLLDESLAMIEADLATLAALSPLTTFALPETPITEVMATVDDVASVRFAIGDERFLFEEETDWSERGGPVVRGELHQRGGDGAELVPASTPDERRHALARHLQDSVVVLATDLRDRALDGEAMPADATLADLANPCPVCGGWRDWRGTCALCAERSYQRQQLTAEAVRLAKDRDVEENDRHKWAERLAVTRRRLTEVDAEIASLVG
jgi:hypothetical protein